MDFNFFFVFMKMPAIGNILALGFCLNSLDQRILILKVWRWKNSSSSFKISFVSNGLVSILHAKLVKLWICFNTIEKD
jgi:hypothetical protein